MDYRTLYIFDIVSLAIYTGALLVLALKNRRMIGMAWFAASVGLELVKAILQSFRGTLPPWITIFVANQIVVLSFFAMYMGFHWFVVREPMRRWRAWLLLSGTFGLYVLLCLTRSRHAFIASMSPGLVLCAMSAWLLLRHGKGSFRAASRTAAATLFLQVGFAVYRTALIAFVYGPAEASRAISDPRWLFTMFAVMLIGASMVLLYVWFFVVESHYHLRESALTDALTGMLNRRAMTRESEREISRARRSRSPLCLIAIDIDFFKSINDRHGHKGGDQALCALSDLLRRELRQIDLIARLGGEEFALLLPYTQLLGATRVAEKLRRTLFTTPLTLPSGVVHMTITVGVAQLLPSDSGFDSMMQRADKALYRGKTSGRNRVILAEPHRSLEADLHLLSQGTTEPESTPLLIQ